MEQILKILEKADCDFWDEFLEKAMKMQERKFSYKYVTPDKSTCYWIFFSGYRKYAKDRHINNLGG